MDQEHEISPKCDCHRICLNDIQIIYPFLCLVTIIRIQEVRGNKKKMSPKQEVRVYVLVTVV